MVGHNADTDVLDAELDSTWYNAYFASEEEARLGHRLWALAMYGLKRGAEVPFPGDRPARPTDNAWPLRGDLFQRAKAAVSIEEFASRFTTLKPSGHGRMKGLCPVHSERSPSFFVFPERQSWRCFGACAGGGDVIALVQRLMEAGRW